MDNNLENKDLKEILNEKDIPDLSAESCDRIIKTSVARFEEVGEQEYKENNKIAKIGFISFWKQGLAFAICLLVVVIYQNRQTTELRTELASLKQQIVTDRDIFQSYQEVFNGNLKAMVSYDGHVDLVMDENRMAEMNTPIVINFTTNGQKVQIIGYSGQNIPVNVNGKIMALDVMLSGDNKIIVTTDRFLWQEGQSNENALSLDAEILKGI